MKNRLRAFSSAALLGLLLCEAGASQSYAQSQTLHLDEDTFVRVPALEFTLATVALDKYLRGVPLDFTRTERAFSQVRPGVNYDQGMVWLTFKYGGGRSFLSQIGNFRITKKVRSSWRLASSSSYKVEESAPDTIYPIAARTDSAPATKRHLVAPAKTVSEMTVTEIAPGALTVDRLSTNL